jgi:hypothetical protein
MITVRAEQMDALARALYDSFRGSVISGVRAAARGRGEALDAEAAGAAVDAALARAAKHGIVERDDLYKLGDLLIALGTGFDTDAKMPWAGFLFRHHELSASAKLDLIAAKAASLSTTDARRAGEDAGR